MATQAFCDATDARDLDRELAEANAAYEQWLLELPRESCGQWSEVDESMLPAPF